MAYVCKKCGRRFASRKVVRRHLRLDHGFKKSLSEYHEYV
jgi:DNA-directed RNA polymerase subunit RPC12/RpoP